MWRAPPPSSVGSKSRTLRIKQRFLTWRSARQLRWIDQADDQPLIGEPVDRSHQEHEIGCRQFLFDLAPESVLPAIPIPGTAVPVERARLPVRDLVPILAGRVADLTDVAVMEICLLYTSPSPRD